MFADKQPQPFALEITVISAEGLKKRSALSCCVPFVRCRLRPYATLRASQNGAAFHGEYRTRADDQERENPRWDEKFSLPVGADFFSDAYPSSVYVHVYAERPGGGKGHRRQLGWCQIPLEDIRPPGASVVRHLSYRLRDRDGTRGRGIVNVALKVQGWLGTDAAVPPRPPRVDTCGTVIGIPLTLPLSKFARRA